jgi:hypothetical protein
MTKRLEKYQYYCNTILLLKVLIGLGYMRCALSEMLHIFFSDNQYIITILSLL